MNKYDLTTQSGLQLAKGAIMNGFMNYNPLVGLAYKAIIKLIDSGKDSIEVQKKTAETLIKQGKDSGADEIEIKLKTTNGFKLKVPLEDINIDTMLGNDNEMTIKVKYK